MKATITSSDSIIDVRDVIARFEELEAATDNPQGYEPIDGMTYDEAKAEYEALKALLDELKGNGGDEKWLGDWYPITLIRDDYFTEYAEELVKDCGYIHPELPSWIAIDWEKTAEAVQQDYTSVEFGGDTYWYR